MNSFNDKFKQVSFNEHNFTWDCRIHPSLCADNQIFTGQITPKYSMCLQRLVRTLGNSNLIISIFKKLSKFLEASNLF